MRRILILALLCIGANVYAQHEFKFVEGSDLCLTGKLMMDTSNPYNRVDTLKYKGFTKSENNQVRMSAGLAVAFRTNSTAISVMTQYGKYWRSTNMNAYAGKGYDLYILSDGKWVHAASGVQPDSAQDENLVLISEMDDSYKTCLLYLPLFSEVYSVKIGVDAGSDISSIENPFRHRVGVFGSSFTHGSCATRSGMSWPSQFSRNTGIQLLNLGCAGNCKMQPYFADVLADAQVDAFLFDTFSNPNAEIMKERLFPFIEMIQKAHPGKPLIFQETIYRQNRTFSREKDIYESRKSVVADSLMKIAQKKYKDVYYITPDASSESFCTSVDGVHPDNYGYALWAGSIERQVLRILRKYSIR